MVLQVCFMHIPLNEGGFVFLNLCSAGSGEPIQ
jgi:hypothetical protein